MDKNDRLRAAGLAALLSAALSASPAEPVPPKTVVLTFDDAVKSHRELVAPLLKQYGFGATFFVSHAWMTNREHIMSWKEVAKLYQMGFEIGNHTWTHAACNTPRQAARLAGELALVENELAGVGVPKPITFGWTGNAFGPDCLAVLERAGYRLARRGMQPEVPYGSLGFGPLFEPHRHHPLLIPSAGDAYPDWTLDHFQKVVDRAREGQIAVLQFHGVPDLLHPWVNTPPERFRKYMNYLKQGGFHVIAMRDLLPYLPDTPVKDDPLARTQYPARSEDDFCWPMEIEQTLPQLESWLPNMIRDHRYTLDEVIQVTGWPRRALEQRLANLGSDAALPQHREWTKVLPYPGGRHPRVGFREGAIDPLRGTKASIFPPWENGGYVVLDIPEAIFSNLGLVFLAHTHVPTIWNAQNVVIENRDWAVEKDGGLCSEWRLPNGIIFGARVLPAVQGADLELWLENGTAVRLTGLRAQICAMLKAAPGFNEQNQDRKAYEKPLAVVEALDARRYLLLAFEHCGRAWGNEKCPCIHSDPVLPDAAPGERVAVRGYLRFYEGHDIGSQKTQLLRKLGKLAER